MKIFKICTSKDTIQTKKTSTEWEKIFANHISDKSLRSRIYRELLRLDNNDNKKSIQKWTKEKKKWTKGLNKHFSKEDIQTTIGP